MQSLDTVRTKLLALPEVTEEPHFEKTSFRVKSKIFATCDEQNNRLCIKLSEADQHSYSLADKESIYAVDNKWGKHGWTFVDLVQVKDELLQRALLSAYCTVAPKKLAESIANRR